MFASCASTKVYSRLGSTSSDLGGTRLEMPFPCIGVAMTFNWGAPNQKSHAMTSSEIFKRGTFCGTKISQNGRSEAVAWFGT